MTAFFVERKRLQKRIEYKEKHILFIPRKIKPFFFKRILQLSKYRVHEKKKKSKSQFQFYKSLKKSCTKMIHIIYI